MSDIRVNSGIRVTTGANSVPDVTSGTGQEVTAGLERQHKRHSLNQRHQAYRW